MIPKSSLDDRTFNDIVDEALRLIPRYCSEWTNHNPSDPGITLIELFAWMTEMTLYRLNKVPEKTYLSLLELMGLSLVPPQSARAVVQFFPVEGFRRSITIKKSTQIAAVSGSSDAYVFETEKDICVNNTKLLSCVIRKGEAWTDYYDGETLSSFSLFETHNSVSHYLYLSSPSLQYLLGDHAVQIAFKEIQELSSVREEIVNYLSWEYWDGRSWVQMPKKTSIAASRKKDNTIYLTGPVFIEPVVVQDVEGYFVRALLSDIPDNSVALKTKGITCKPYFSGNGFLPDMCIANSDVQYALVDMNTTFRMFSESPSFNEIFYIAADEVFQKAGTKVHLMFTFSEIYVSGGENENAVFVYEYWDGNNWLKLNESQKGFHDDTFNFKQAGTVTFTAPDNIKKITVNGEEHYWVRIRLVTKDFSIGGEYIKDEKDNWVWVFTSKVHSPLLSRIRITYEAQYAKPEAVLVNSNFSWFSIPELCISNQNEPENDVHNEREFALFDIANEQIPSLYLGFTSSFPQGDASFYIKIDESKSSKPKQALPSFFKSEIFSSAPEKRYIDILWEYWNGKRWAVLSVNDFTDSFHESGFIEFTTPQDFSSTSLFSKDLYYIRARLLSGSFEYQPLVQSILLNAVSCQNIKTYINEIAGSGTGAPGQRVSPSHGPILPGSVIYIDEGSIPPANELDLLLKEGVDEPFIEEGESVWVRYTEVENFYSSTPFSRHFIVDYKQGVIYFGDGVHGINPPRGKFNIKLASYSTGGGVGGNVASNTLTILTKSIPFISGCTNPFPAQGGSDMETVDNLKSRAAGVFKSLQRAVTAEDFQWLAREASASVGRAYCLQEKNRYGETCIAIIPTIPPGAQLSEKLIPSRELIRRVTVYLNDRKLVGTKIRVHEPVYRSFQIHLSLAFKSDVLDEQRLKKTINQTLFKYFHALEGAEGRGWDFGRPVTTGAVLKQIEKINGILSVDEIALFDKDTGITVEKLVLKTDEIPFLQDVQIENRRAIS